MFIRSTFRVVAVCALIAALSACSALRRDDDAAAAKAHMFGMSRENVLACMGPPKKKAAEGATEVWSYLSTDGQSNYNGYKVKPTGFEGSSGSHNRNFCTVNIVMKDGFVKAVHYLGPTATHFFTTQDQCGYAVAACVDHAE